jgi:phospholipid/cholesterol/gamma-HCH transport system permease protein
VKDTDTVSLQYESKGATLSLVIRGRLDVSTTGRLWDATVNKVAKSRPGTLEVDAEGVESCDSAGMALLLELKSRQESHGRRFIVKGLRPELAELVTVFDPGPAAKPAARPNVVVRGIESIGRATLQAGRDLYELVSFTGEVAVKSVITLVRPHRFRWSEAFLTADKAGANGTGITAMLGFLIGVILAFQTSIGMGKFGARIYVADLVTITLFRELGPLIAAVILASRSGSAFAAEIGTMKINEEIDALTTMGIDPVRFLVLPRVVATVFVLPLLTVFNILLGLIGCGLVMVLIGFAPPLVVEQIQHAAKLDDLFSGLVKTFVFGWLIAAIGSLRGLQTGTGASAVGDAATRAVVSSIVAIIVTDGIFAVAYWFLRI